nr:hypothetical protein HK105_006132 [Polyrhizophydium stewartii]
MSGIESLKAMFPNIDAEVVEAIFESNGRDVDATANLLLEMSDPAAQGTQAAQQQQPRATQLIAEGGPAGQSAGAAPLAALPQQLKSDEQLARELAQQMEDEELARRLQEEEQQSQAAMARQHLSDTSSDEGAGEDLGGKFIQGASQLGESAKKTIMGLFDKVQSSFRQATSGEPSRRSAPYTNLPKHGDEAPDAIIAGDGFEEFLDAGEPPLTSALTRQHTIIRTNTPAMHLATAATLAAASLALVAAAPSGRRDGRDIESYDRGNDDYGYGGFPWCKKRIEKPEWGTDGKPYGWEDGRSCIIKDGRHGKEGKKGDRSDDNGKDGRKWDDYSSGEYSTKSYASYDGWSGYSKSDDYSRDYAMGDYGKDGRKDDDYGKDGREDDDYRKDGRKSDDYRKDGRKSDDYGKDGRKSDDYGKDGHKEDDYGKDGHKENGHGKDARKSDDYGKDGRKEDDYGKLPYGW